MSTNTFSKHVLSLLIGAFTVPCLAQGPIQVVHDYGLGNLLGGLVQVPDGSFYGVLGDDGNNFPPPPNSFIVHVLSDGTSQTVLSFPTDGSLGLNPNALVQATDGNLYGTTRNGGSGGFGTIFRFSAAHGLQTIHTFTGPDGQTPVGRLLQATDGKLYGAAASGGTGEGTLFRISLAGTFESLWSFTGTDGPSPNGNLVQLNGAFFGTTASGGASGTGTIFAFVPGSTLTTVHVFGAADGCPNPLTVGPGGKLYGTTAEVVLTSSAACFASGSINGSIFKLDPATFQYTRLYAFGTHASDGAFPNGPLLAANDGKLYGVTEIGGTSEFSVGTFFSFSLTGGLSTVDFGGTNQGGSPCCELLQTIAGPIYGVTQGFTSIEGGSPDSVIFSAAPTLAAPKAAIAGFSPQSGRPGTAVLLVGTHFLGASAVSFNGVSAPYLVSSTGSIYTFVPTGATTGKISVTNPGGVVSSAGSFTVTP